MRTRSVLIVGFAVAMLAFAACGGDDGGGVREVGGGSGSGSGSGSGASGSGSGGSGSGSGSGAAAEEKPECRPFGDKGTATSTVNVQLNEFAIVLDTNTAPAGKIAFVATDTGEEPHELVILHGGPTNLPTDKDGALDEKKLPGGTLVGEIEPFPVGETCDGTFDLSPGEYTLLCNVVETEKNGKHESHLKEGMVTTFTVT
jgi:hypothetical protein